MFSFNLTQRLVGTTVAVLLVAAPLSMSAATVPATASFTDSTLTTSTSKPTFSGVASDTKTVKVVMYKEGTSKKTYTSSTLKVRNGAWKVKVSKKLSDGKYDVLLFGKSTKKGTELDRGVFQVGATSSSTTVGTSGATGGTFAVQSVPLLYGGEAHAGKAVPVSYLQITNTGTKEATLNGFWVKQNGSASPDAVIGLTTVDDQGGSRGSAGGTEGASLFSKGVAFVPTRALFAPGQMRLFTIKAILTKNVAAHLGKQLSLDVQSLDVSVKGNGVFPIRGTTWTIAE
jgi:hypothetical protein